MKLCCMQRVRFIQKFSSVSDFFDTGRVIHSSGMPTMFHKACEALLRQYPQKQLKEDIIYLQKNTKSPTITGELRLKRHKEIASTSSGLQKTVQYGPRESMAQLFAHAPTQFSVIFRVLDEIKRRFASFSPSSVLDFGCGSGTGLWATSEVWSSIKTDHDATNYFATSSFEYTGVDTSEDMLKLAHKMIQVSAELKCERDFALPDASKITFKRFFSHNAVSNQKLHSLTICAYVLHDLFLDLYIFESTCKRLFDLTRDFLVFIDYPDAAGFERLRVVKRLLLDYAFSKNERVQVVAPCVYPAECQNEKCACFFELTTQLPKIFQQLTGTKKSKMTSEFTYLVLQKTIEITTESMNWSRIVGTPSKLKKYIKMNLCTPEGTFVEGFITKDDGPEAFKDARKSKWGDLWPHPFRVIKHNHKHSLQPIFSRRLLQEAVTQEEDSARQIIPLLEGCAQMKPQ